MGCGATMIDSRLILAALTAAAILAAVPVRAQSSAVQPASGQTATQDGKQDSKQDKRTQPPTASRTDKPAAKDGKQGATRNSAAADSTKPAPAPHVDSPRSIASSNATTKETPRIKPSELARIPVQGGSFGFSSETMMKRYELPDGTRMRGVDHAITKSREPTFFGLSLSVPTTGSIGSDSRSDLPPPRN